jgi:hypothetical protein
MKLMNEQRIYSPKSSQRNINLQKQLSYYNSVLFRVLPNVYYNFERLKFLYNDKKIKSYFKGVRKLQAYPGVLNYFKSYGFDTSLAESISQDILNTKPQFLKNIQAVHSTISNRSYFRGLCGITPKHLEFLTFRIGKDLFPTFISPSYPTFDDVRSSIRQGTSSGLPNPFLSKRSILNDILNVLNKFYSKTLKPSDILQWPSATFLRSQIRSSGLKFRIVHAVQAFQIVIEVYFYKLFQSVIPQDSCVTLGKTQKQISDITSSYTDLQTYSIDYSKWDVSRQPVLSVISFDIFMQYIPMSAYHRRFLIALRNSYLTLPMFHPTVELCRRWIGTVSGSGFTSLDNSVCNYILVTCTIFNYCLKKNVDPYKFYFKLNTSGDDLIIGFDHQIDFELFSRLAYNHFGCNMSLELEVIKPGINQCFFLGSKWVDGKPYRSEKVMVASVIFGSGNFPKMDIKTLIKSRFIEVFGNSSDTAVYFKRFRKSLDDSHRLFFFNELYTPFRTGNTERVKHIRPDSSNKVDSRGFWFTQPFSHEDLSCLWETR